MKEAKYSLAHPFMKIPGLETGFLWIIEMVEMLGMVGMVEMVEMISFRCYNFHKNVGWTEEKLFLIVSFIILFSFFNEFSYI